MHNYYSDIEIVAALDEADFGNHVSHITDLDSGRTVAIRPAWGEPSLDDNLTRHDSFNLTFSDPEFDLRNVIGGGCRYDLKRRDTIRLIRVFLTGPRIESESEEFTDYINQTDRECSIEDGSITPTRLRIEYELPRAGWVATWRHYLDFHKFRPQADCTPGHNSDRIFYISGAQ